MIEPRDSALLFPQAIEDYKARLDDASTGGAVFFAVCRGKVGVGRWCGQAWQGSASRLLLRCVRGGA